MNTYTNSPEEERHLQQFFAGKSAHTLALFDHFIYQFKLIGEISVHPAKTMIGIANHRRRIVYVTQLGKNFVHAVFPFKRPYNDNLCFQKIANVPGDQQYNHHLRVFTKEDINDEVMDFMLLAYNNEEIK